MHAFSNGFYHIKRIIDGTNEAIGKGVQLTPVERFLERNKDAQNRPKIVQMRLKTDYQNLIQSATLFCLAQMSVGYDDAFLMDNKKYYCSELLYDAFTFANQGKAFFALQPMTFIDPTTSQNFPAWIDYYDALKQPIPEGKLGCNPGSIANSPFLTTVHIFY